MRTDPENVQAHGSAAPVGSANQAQVSADDDMIDAPSDFKRWPILYQLLGDCRDSIVFTYLHSDAAALDAQRIHRDWVVRAALFATLAVCLAILQLAHLRYGFMWIMEGCTVAAAAWAFRRGEKSRERWLTERHKAERCRLLKFGAMIRPTLWSLDMEPASECTSELTDQIDALKRLSFKDVKKWLDEDRVPSPPGRVLPRSLTQLMQLRDYYREKRLKFQAGYFERQSERDVKRDELWRSVPPRLFTASVMIVALHVVVEAALYLGNPERIKRLGVGQLHSTEIIMDAVIACAAVLPVVGSGIRTWRSAHEATRNISRFRSKHLALNNIAERLAESALEDATQAESVLRDLWYAEQIMESEHREWLRLMIDSEWLG